MTILKQAAMATLGVLGVLLGAYLLYALREILIIAVIALTFASAIAPLVSRLHRRLPLAPSIAVVYLALLLAVGGLGGLIVPPAVGQVRVLVADAPELLAAAQERIAGIQRSLGLPRSALTPDLRGNYSRLTESAPQLASGALDVTLGFITGIAGVGIALVLAFYWLLERRDIEGASLSLVSRDGRGQAREIIGEVEEKLGGYVRGQLTLAVIVGLLSLVGLLVLGVPFALVLAIIAGVSELIPLAGPIIGAVPAILVALAVSPLKALLVAGLYILIQQLENHVLVPKVMQRAVGLSPLTVVFAVLAGATLGGIVGVLLAVPIASTASVILGRLVEGRQRREDYA